ncbi:radial spoke head 1 homolog [Biomphalaria glabrata]|uniref:Radial spoke head 1 homolog n=3 Tax=Biomphalaria glabrata TaxID=6526 RepID=A0A9W3BDB4_BIOGL|nr:radial spoke head 1 homolog [Biomphalaria glabrata]XP_055897563.1 radial spoke head 1 homolog [Biomphalaria glabrata]
MEDDERDVEDDFPTLGEYIGDRNEKNERHGKGRALLPNRDVYDGNYMFGKRDGQGVYKFKNKLAKNARYIGNYVQGKKQGFGKFIYPDGSRYEGNWVDDLKEGQGKYFYVNGDVYSGDWSKGLRHGKGTYTYANGTKYVGSWCKGKWEGFGEFHYCNYKYCGRFRDNKMFGYGKFVFDVACELHGQYVLDNKDEISGLMDLAQEAALVILDEQDRGIGEDFLDDVGETTLRMPPSPPPIGPTHFEAGMLTGLHVMTPEEEEEARLVDELNALRATVEAQIAARKEAELRRQQAEAAKWAREEAERVTLEILAEGADVNEEVLPNVALKQPSDIETAGTEETEQKEDMPAEVSDLEEAE